MIHMDICPRCGEPGMGECPCRPFSCALFTVGESDFMRVYGCNPAHAAKNFCIARDKDAGIDDGYIATFREWRIEVYDPKMKLFFYFDVERKLIPDYTAREAETT